MYELTATEAGEAERDSPARKFFFIGEKKLKNRFNRENLKKINRKNQTGIKN